MKGDGQGAGQDFVQDAGFFFLTIENVDVADALGVFYFWRENKEREEKLYAGSYFKLKVMR